MATASGDEATSVQSQTATLNDEEDSDVPDDNCLFGCLNMWANCVDTNETNEGVIDYWDAHTKIHWQDEDRDSVSGVINIIKHYAEEEEDFDIYQICAFNAVNCGTKTYYMSVFKAVFCILLQAPSLVYIIYTALVDMDKEWCNLDDISAEAICSKILAFLYSYYLGFYIMEQFRSQGYRGMYCIIFMDLCNKPPFINGNWIRMGGYYNILLGQIAVVGSYVLIFTSDSVLDLVLNCVALFFVCELDDMLVTRYDYFKVAHYIKHHYFNANGERNSKPVLDENPDLKFNLCLCCCEVVGCRGIELIIMLVRLLLPFYIGICS